MRFLVTGATGFIGGALTRQLLADGHDVVALARSPAKARGLADAGATVVEGDVTDRTSLLEPLRAADGVFHLAAWYDVGLAPDQKRFMARVNVEGTRNVLEAMRETGVRKGVYASTVAVYGDTRGNVVDESYRAPAPGPTAYDETKWRAHHEVAVPAQEAGLPLVIVQPGVVYGPRDTSPIGRVFRMYLKRKLPAIPGGTAYCWAHVEDVARGFVLAMEKGRTGEAYNLTGPVHSHAEALAVAESVTGVPAPRVTLPPVASRALAGVSALAERFARLPPEYASETLRAAAGVTYLASREKAVRELGWKVRPLREGLEETLRFEMDRLGLRPSPAHATV